MTTIHERSAGVITRCATKYVAITSRAIASIQVSVEENQSFCSPRSSNSCSAPMLKLKVANPKYLDS